MPSNLVKALVATVVGVLLVPLAGMSTPAYAAVGTPVLTYPVNDSLGNPTLVTANPVLNWDRVAGAVKYEVQVASSSDFLAPLKFSSSTLNSRATPPADLAIGSWWWRVRAIDSANVAGAYAVSTFSKEPAAAPVVLTPIDLAVLEYPSDPLVYSWQPMAGAKTYEVQVDDDVNFVGAPAAVSTNNTRYVPTSPPTFNTIFFWHVRGVSTQGVPTQWSEPRSNRMTWASLPPVLVSPPSTKIVNIEDTIEEIVLDWQPVIGASAYELQISPDDQFNAPIGGTRVVRATTFAPSPTLPAGAYFWRVRALSTSAVPEPGVWSEIWTFTRAWPAQSGITRPRGTDGAGNGLLPQVQLLLPDNDAVVSVPNFTWTPQREASNYQFEVGTDANFSSGTFQTCLTNHTAFTPYSGCSPSLISPGRVLYWRVKALDGAVNGVYSRDVNPDGSLIREVRRFMYDPAFVTQTSPVDGSTVDGAPVLRWNPIDNISRYKVTMDPSDATCPTVTAFTYNTIYVPEALKTTCAGPIQWTVQSVVSSGALSRLIIQSSWPTFTLGTQSSPGSSADPIMLTDIDGDPSTPLVMDRFTPPLMQWSPVTNATHYRVFATIDGFSSYTAMNVSTNWPGFVYTGENSTLGKMLDGNYDFYVEAYSSTNAVLATSAVSQFTVSYNIALTSPWPTLMKPDNCLPASCTTLLYDTPTLDWTSVPGAGYYTVYLATDPNFTNITRSWSTAFNQLTPLESLPDSQAGQATYWFIRPCFAAGACSAFDPSVFWRAHAFRKTSAPIDGATTIQANTPTHDPCTLLVPCSDEVTFTWNDYLATNDALTPVATQEARNYQVQVSTTAGFTNIIDTSPYVDQTTYTAQTTTYPDGPLFWRVRAFDNTGNPLTFSQLSPSDTAPIPFIKTSSVPFLTAPASGSLQSGAPLLTWDPLPFTNTYAVEIYKNPSAPLATGNRVASITTRSTAAIPTVTLPKGDYGWRVQRIDVNGKAGPWTSLDNTHLLLFTVQGPVPTLLSPVSGSKIETTTVFLQWTAAPGASRYLAEASTSSTFTSLIDSVTTDMTAWAPGEISPAWPNATIYWRVSTLDATGQRLATSNPPPALPWSISTSTKPAAPTAVKGIAGYFQVAVSWTAPASNGSAITEYTVAASPGGKTFTTTGATAVTATGLTYGTAYTFTVTATNANGTSRPSSPSVAVKPTDGVVPAVLITSKPAVLTASSSAIFSFSGTDGTDAASSLRYLCSRDGATASACTSPVTYTALTSAVHTFTVKVLDPSGNSRTAAYSWRVDRLVPTLTMTAPATGYSLTTSLAPAWSAKDVGGGLANVDVRWARAAWNGGFTAAVYPSTWQKTTATKATLSSVTPGYTSCFSARARDKAGNLSAWSAPRCSAVAMDDRSLAVSTGWSRVTSSVFYRGTATVTSRSAVTLTRTGVQAKRIYLVATRCATCGTVGVYWNGILIKKVSLYSSTLTRRSVIGVTTFTGVRSGTLTIKTLTSNKAVQIDGVALNRG